MELLNALLVLLLVTRALGEIAERLGQPALTGELTSGILLGLLFRKFSESFPVLSGLPENEIFTAVTYTRGGVQSPVGEVGPIRMFRWGPLPSRAGKWPDRGRKPSRLGSIPKARASGQARRRSDLVLGPKQK
jgi:hypothetical protein